MSGKSERESIQKNIRRKDKGLTSYGVRRYGLPKRSERQWWKEGYSGYYYPDYQTNETLANHVEACKRRNNK